MEILNYRGLDNRARWAAYRNPNLDPDMRRVLEVLYPEFRAGVPGQQAAPKPPAPPPGPAPKEGASKSGVVARKNRYLQQQPRGRFDRWRPGRRKHDREAGHHEMQRLTEDAGQNGAKGDDKDRGDGKDGKGGGRKQRPRLAEPLLRSETLLTGLLDNARHVTGREPRLYEKRLLERVSEADLGGVLELAHLDRGQFRAAFCEVPTPRGKVFKLPYLHLLVLHHCLHRDAPAASLVPRIITAAYTVTWNLMGHAVGDPVDALAQWELEPGVFSNLSALHLAAFYGDNQMVAALIGVSADVNVQNEAGDTPLLLAMSGEGANRRGIVQMLLRRGADVNLANEDGTTPLHGALAAGGGKALVSLLLGRGADVDAVKRRGLQTPLTQAVAFGEVELAELLLVKGADVFYITPRHQTALHYAVVGTRPELVTKLMDHADTKGLNTLHNSADLDGNTPFLLAVALRGGKQEDTMATIRALLDRGASLDAQNVMGRTVWDSAWRREEVLDMLVEAHLRRVTTEAVGWREVPVVPLSPLHVAAHCNNVPFLRKLLDKGLNPHEADSRGLASFLHIAATENRKLVIAEPFGNYDDLLQAVNRNLDTPLHVAARKGTATTVTEMMSRANKDLIDDWLHLKNRQGITPFYVALLRGNPKVAQVISEKMREIRDTEVDLEIAEDTDAVGNTYLHLAAKRGFTDICRQLMALNVNVNQRNERGNTPLHEAAHAGKEDAVTCLLRLGEDGVPATPGDAHQTTADLLIKNNSNRTVLHTAADSVFSSAPLIQTLVKVITKDDPSGIVLNEADEEGNTAVHLAVRRATNNLYDVIIALGQCNFEVCNNDGDTPLHLAARNPDPSVLTALLGALDTLGATKPLDVTNNGGLTVLMLAMEAGHARLVVRLVLSGANLAHRARLTGDTALHHLVRLSVQQPHLAAQWHAMYYSICQSATTWWCAYHEVEEPDARYKQHRHYKEVAVKFLTSAVRNTAAAQPNTLRLVEQDPTIEGTPLDVLGVGGGEGLTVIQLTTALGASRLMDAIYQTRGVYKTSYMEDNVLVPRYDVTYVTPDLCKFGRSGAADRPRMLSVVESLAYMDDEAKVIEFLNITPIKQLSQNYWARYQWIYVLLMLLHIIYMSLLCYFGLQLQLIPSQNTLEAGATTVSPAVPAPSDAGGNFSAPEPPPGWLGLMPYTPLLAWPLVLLLYLLINFAFRMRRWHASRALDTVREAARERRRLTVSAVWGWFSSLRVLHDEAVTFFGVLFAACVLLWFGFLAAGSMLQVYFLVVAFCLGWVFTVAFTKGFESVNAFSIMLKYIIVIDIFRFFFVFVFIFLGFSLALQAVFLHTPTHAEQFASIWYTYFYVFRMMLAVDDPFDDTFNAELRDAGIHAALPKVIYVAFMIITSIVFLNLLIAMMSDTYSHVTAREATHWRVANMRLAIGLERQLRRFKHYLRFPVRTEFVLQRTRTSIQPKSLYGAEFCVQAERHYASFPQETAPLAGEGEELEGTAEGRLKEHLEQQVATLTARMAKLEAALQGVTQGKQKSPKSSS